MHQLLHSTILLLYRLRQSLLACSSRYKVMENLLVSEGVGDLGGGGGGGGGQGALSLPSFAVLTNGATYMS